MAEPVQRDRGRDSATLALRIVTLPLEKAMGDQTAVTTAIIVLGLELPWKLPHNVHDLWPFGWKG